MFELTLHKTQQGMTLELIGELDTGAAGQLDQQLEAIAGTWPGDLRIELGGLSYLNSMGIRALLHLHKLLGEEGRTFVLVGCSPRIFRIFHYCGLDGYFNFEPIAEPAPRMSLAAGGA